ncbi:uncharacterized protein VTP21DRAFT_4128 [Calcarisporiella thermophila]|uniref:uncharacterized protein n=1 Tax=Calcarisporiella thermophila TaxID=911321 RepID=UPI003743498D
MCRGSRWECTSPWKLVEASRSLHKALVLFLFYLQSPESLTVGFSEAPTILSEAPISMQLQNDHFKGIARWNRHK